MNYSRLRYTILGLLAILPTAAHAAAITNGGFEAPVINIGTTVTYSSGADIGGWTVVGASAVVHEKTYAELANSINAFTSQEGNQAIDLTGAFNSGLNTGITQSTTTIPGITYTIQFFVGRASGNAIYATPSTADLQIDSGARISFTNSDSTPNTINWKEFSQNFVATGATTQITFLSGTTSNNYVGLDNVRIVPEPSCAVLCLAGILSSFGFRRNRRCERNG